MVTVPVATLTSTELSVPPSVSVMVCAVSSMTTVRPVSVRQMRVVGWLGAPGGFIGKFAGAPIAASPDRLRNVSPPRIRSIHPRRQAGPRRNRTSARAYGTQGFAQPVGTSPRTAWNERLQPAEALRVEIVHHRALILAVDAVCSVE